MYVAHAPKQLKPCMHTDSPYNTPTTPHLKISVKKRRKRCANMDYYLGGDVDDSVTGTGEVYLLEYRQMCCHQWCARTRLRMGCSFSKYIQIIK